MALEVHKLALDLIVQLRPLVTLIRRHDADLAKQIRRAASSTALNIGEGEYALGGNKRSRFATAAGSAHETLTGLQVAVAWGYFDEAQAAEAVALANRVLAMLWRLWNPPR